MRVSLIPAFCVALALVTGCGPETAPASDATWRSDTAAALAEATSAKRPVVLRFTAVWCPPCQDMAKDVWPDPALVQPLARFTRIKADSDDPTAQPLFQQYKIEGIPTTILLGSDGTELVRKVGFVPVAEVLDLVSKVP